MTDPVVLRVVRPYGSEAELLAAEGWTISMRRVILIGERPLKRGTVVRVELALANGEKILRAEGKVAGVTKSEDDRPKGLEVRLKRYGASTRAFLERASRAAGEPSSAAEAAPLADRETEPDSEPSRTEVDSSPRASVELDAPSSPGEALDPLPESDRSGVRMRVVEAPPNREALLERLRERARKSAGPR